MSMKRRHLALAGAAALAAAQTLPLAAQAQGSDAAAVAAAVDALTKAMLAGDRAGLSIGGTDDTPAGAALARLHDGGFGDDPELSVVLQHMAGAHRIGIDLHGVLVNSKMRAARTLPA